MGILETLTDDNVEEVVQSYNGFCASMEALLGSSGDISIDSEFVSYVTMSTSSTNTALSLWSETTSLGASSTSLLPPKPPSPPLSSTRRHSNPSPSSSSRSAHNPSSSNGKTSLPVQNPCRQSRLMFETDPLRTSKRHCRAPLCTSKRHFTTTIYSNFLKPCGRYAEKSLRKKT